MPDGPGVSYKTETECSGGGRPVQANWFGQTGREAYSMKRLMPRQARPIFIKKARRNCHSAGPRPYNKRDGDCGAGAYSASPLVSPVRMRTAWEISSTKILPSPIRPVL